MELLSIQVLILLGLLGTCAGFLAGLLGLGGGIIFVPMFLWAFDLAGFPPDIIVHSAFGTSLALILPTAFSSTLGHRKRGNVDWRYVGLLSVGGALGSVAGASLAVVLSGVWLKALFGIMQILVALKLFWFNPRLPPERSDPAAPMALLLVGAAGGFFSAFFGVGGGIIAVPLMVILLQLPIHLAVGNSSALIVVSAIFGVLSYVLHGLDHPGLPPFSFGYVNLLVAAVVAPFTVLAARLGVRVAGRFSHDKLINIFAVLLVLVGLRMIWQTLMP